MTLLIRRSAATAAGDSAEDLAESIAIEDVYELLFRRGESDLAAAVTATLAASSATIARRYAPRRPRGWGWSPCGTSAPARPGVACGPT